MSRLGWHLGGRSRAGPRTVLTTRAAGARSPWRFLIASVGAATLALTVPVELRGSRVNPGPFAQGIREGLTAQTGFEVVPVASVPTLASPGGPAAADGRSRVRTFRLDPDPDAYSVSGPTVSGIRSVTLVAAGGNPGDLVFDLYLHGGLEDPATPAFRIPGLDLRKFLHQSLSGVEGVEDVARLQAYFAELARRAKILYPLPSAASGAASAAAGGSAYQEAVLPLVRDRLRRLLAALTDTPSALRALELAMSRLDAPRGADLRAVDQNLRALARSLEKGQGDGNPGTEALEELTAARDAVLALSTAQKVSDIVVTNNCREPGNYEIALRDASGRKLLHGAFAFPPDAYDRMLRSHHGIGIPEQATGTRFSSSLQQIDAASYGETAHLGSRAFPQVRLAAVEGALAPPARGPRRSRPLKGKLGVVGGFIPYEDYETEVQVKSGYHGNDDPLSFVVVDPAKPAPFGFEPPVGTSSSDYWLAPRNAGKAVPHTFLKFEDILRYDVRLSGFEVNGVYIGRTDLEIYDPERQEGRWPFHYGYLRYLKSYELTVDEAGLTHLRLLPSRKGTGVGFSFGNVAVAVGETVEILFGIGSQPLIAPYNDDVFQDPLAWAVAFDARGWVVDHHGPDVGVEQVYIERLGPSTYRVRLVAHERILPVWEALLGTS